MAMPNQPLAARAIGLVSMGGEKSVQLGLNRLRDQLPRTLTQQIRQRVERKSFWRAKCGFRKNRTAFSLSPGQ